MKVVPPQVVRLHNTWVRVVPQPAGYLWIEPVPTPPKPDPCAAVLATISGSPLF